MPQPGSVTIVNVGYRSTNYWIVSASTSRLLVDLGEHARVARALDHRPRLLEVARLEHRLEVRQLDRRQRLGSSLERFAAQCTQPVEAKALLLADGRVRHLLEQPLALLGRRLPQQRVLAHGELEVVDALLPLGVLGEAGELGQPGRTGPLPDVRPEAGTNLFPKLPEGVTVLPQAWMPAPAGGVDPSMPAPAPTTPIAPVVPVPTGDPDAFEGGG